MRRASCRVLHKWARSLPRRTFKNLAGIPTDGIYLLFEKGERGHGGERLVRVGTHTGVGQLGSRIRQHFLMENKDRSIFRKNIGRALLARAHDPYALQWEHDLTSRAGRAQHGKGQDMAKQAKIEKAITKYLCTNCSFVVVPVSNTKKRLQLEAKLIGALASCRECGPSKKWLGCYSPLQKIRDKGLWQVQRLAHTPLLAADLVYLRQCGMLASTTGQKG